MSESQSATTFTGSAVSTAWSEAYSNSAVKNLVGVLQRLAFESNREVVTHRFVLLGVLVVALLQLATLPLEFLLSRCGSELVAPARWMSVIRAPLLGHQENAVVIYVMTAVLGAVMAVVIAEWMALKRSSRAHSRALWALKWTSLALQVGVMPAAHVCLSEFLRLRDSTVTPTAMVVNCIVSGACLAMLGVLAFTQALFFVDFLPASTPVSVVCGRFPLAILGVQAATTATHVFFRSSPSLSPIHGSCLAVCFAALALFSWRLLPYHHKLLNYATFPLWSALTCGGLCSFASSFVATGRLSFVPAVVFACSSVPSVALSAIAVRRKTRKYEKILSRELENPADSVVFKTPMELLWAVRRAFFVSDSTGLTLARALQLTENAEKTFPHSSMVLMVHSVILLEVAHDWNGAARQARTAKRMDSVYDLGYVASCLIQTAQQRSSEEMKREEIESRLSAATKHHNLCRAQTRKFWQMLARSHNDEVDSTALMGVVRTAAYHEDTSNDIFTDLLRHNPRNVRILRAFSRFVQELKNDREGAEQLLVAADEIEEDESRHHHAHNQQGQLRKDAAVIVSVEPESSKVQFVEMEQLPGAATTTGVVVVPAIQSEVSMGGVSSVGGSEGASTIKSSASAKTEESLRARSLRRKIETAKSSMISSLHLAVLVTTLALLACAVTNYAVSTTTMTRFADTVTSMTNAITCRRYCTATGLYVRKYEQELMLGVANASSCLKAQDQIESFGRVFDTMFKASEFSAEISEFWADPDIETKLYITKNASQFSSGSFFTQKTTLWDAGSTLINKVGEVCAVGSLGGGGVQNLRTNSGFRYVMDTAPLTLPYPLRDLSILYSQGTVREATTIENYLYGFFPGTILAAALVAALVYWPVLRKVVRERRSAIRLFMDVPRSTIINTFERLSSNTEEEQQLLNDAGSSGTGGGGINRRERLSSVAKLNLYYFAAILVASILCLAIFAVAISFARSEKYSGNAIRAAGARQNIIVALLMWSQEMVVDDSTTFARNETWYRFHDFYRMFLDYDRALKYNSASMQVTGLIRSDPDLFDLWYARDCPVEVSRTVKNCKGLGMLMRYYIDTLLVFVEGFRNNTRESGAFDNAGLYDQAWSINGPLVQWLEEDLQLLHEKIGKNKSRSSTAITALFWVTLPLFCLMYLLVRSVVSTLGSEAKRLFRMLLFVPPNVLETVDSVRELLEMGHSAVEVEALSTKEQERVTKSIVDACEDMVVLCNQNRIIEVFNPVAENLTGWAAENAIGKDLSIVIPTEVEANQKLVSAIFESNGAKRMSSAEVVVKTKAGSCFSSLVSVSKTVVNGKVTTALFVRDITVLKEREEEIIRQRNRSENLLLNILPRQIAEQLREAADKDVRDRAEGGSGVCGGMVIAEKFELATVLFADIVGFTTMSSTMEAGTVVNMLNTVFSAFDSLLDAHRVEKIKTIGDAYMAVTGVPARYEDHAERMVKFGLAMMAYLETYNKGNPGKEIQVRIGINTGPLVAGVIGSRKIAYDLWGDSVNVASRMEHAGVPGAIQVTESTYRAVKDRIQGWECRGEIPIQGKGNMTTWVLKPTTEILTTVQQQDEPMPSDRSQLHALLGAQ